MFCDKNSVNLQLLILLEGIRILDGACSWPTDFAGSTWTDSSKGELVFEDTAMSGWLLNVENLSLDRWECYSTDYFESQGYLIIKTTETFVLYQTRHYYGFLCMQLTKITDVSYRYYEIEPIQENVQNERLNVHDVAMDEPSNLTAMCLLDHGAVGSEYKVLIKKEFEEEAKIRCPYSFLGNFNYEHTSSAGTVACLEADSINLCIDNKEIKFDYDACPTKVAYSASDTVWCVDSVPVGDNNFVTVYNGIDPTVDDANTFRFSCFGVSGDGRNASVTPQNCKKDQSPYSVPTDNSGTQTGATLTMPAEPNFCPPCPILKDPPKGSVSIATNGAVTTATYECVNDYTIAGHRTRICQDNNTWSGHTPSCTCDTPLSPTNGAVTVSTDGTTATYTCIANYTLDGEATRTCETDTNTWTGTDPVCAPCDPLEEVGDGDVTVALSNLNTISVAYYTCNPGATLNGETSRVCHSSGQWTGSKPVCNTCPPLSNSLSGSVNLTTNGTTTTTTFSCLAGYTMIGRQEITCQTDGSWDAEEPQCICNSPTPPLNGDLIITDNNMTAIYVCYSGSTISGPSSRTCRSDGSGWTGADPTCVQCASLTSTEGLQIKISTNGTVSMAAFTCDISYSLNGDSAIQCLHDGSWALVSPSCQLCDSLSSPASGTLAFSTDGTSTQANFSCSTGTSLKGPASVECNSDGSWPAATASCVSCETLEGLQDGSYVISSNGTASTVTYSCTSGYSLTGSSKAVCLDNGTWSFEIKPFCLPDGGSDTNVTQTGTSLLPAVITMAVLLLILIPALTFATYKYCKLKKRGHLKGDTFRDDDVPKSIPIAAVPPSAAPVDHQKPLFESGRATSLSFAPDAHSQYTSRGILSANSRSSTASISRLNLEMIRESTSSSVYGNGGPAPWSKKKPIVSENPDSTREDSLTLSSLYSSFSSPRRGYPHTPRYSDDMDDSTGVSPLTEESTVHETSSPRRSPKKRKKASNKLSHADTEEGANIPSYMKGTKSSVRKVYEEGIMGENKQSAKTTLSVFGNERELTNSGRTTPKLTSPRV